MFSNRGRGSSLRIGDIGSLSATHALVAGDLKAFAQAKAEPALVLTIPEKPTDQDDGLLQATEVSKLKLNADWVMLSACNTAASDGVGAEALSGTVARGGA